MDRKNCGRILSVSQVTEMDREKDCHSAARKSSSLWTQYEKYCNWLYKCPLCAELYNALEVFNSI